MSPSPAPALSVLPMPGVSAFPGGLRIEPAPGAPQPRRALILEDEASFQEVMQCFLGDNGFQVVAVQNGVEGVHEILASDFNVILCDMMMPTLPGDMFYRAVERMRPHLCDKFVFMTGYRGNSKVNDFIATTSGAVLHKPFHMDELLELIAFIELRGLLMAA